MIKIKVLLLLASLNLIFSGCVSRPPIVKATANETSAVCPQKYNRKLWGQWSDADKNCLKTRDEILKRDSLTPVVIENCKVKSGRWKDFYFGDEVTDPKKLEIDHVVPVKEAHESGACNWSKHERKQFYNDIDNLVVATVKNNRSKSASNIAEWQPSDKGRACEQAKIWAKIKRKYRLVIKSDEMLSLNLLKSHGCEINE
jgi:hypothetical protein